MEERSIYVSSSSRYNPDFRTISAACESLSRSGHSSSTPTHIYIVTGRYAENVIIRSNVNLIASGTVVIEGKLTWHVGKNRNKKQSSLIESVALRGIQLIGDLEVVVDDKKDSLCPTSLFITSCNIVGSISLVGRKIGTQDMVLFDKCSITVQSILQSDYEAIFSNCTVSTRRQSVIGSHSAFRLAVMNSEYTADCLLISFSSAAIISSKVSGRWTASSALLSIEDSSVLEDGATIDMTSGSLAEVVSTTGVVLTSSDRTGGWNPPLLNIPFTTTAEGDYIIPMKPHISSVSYDVIRSTNCQVLEIRREELIVRAECAGAHSVVLSYRNPKTKKG